MPPADGVGVLQYLRERVELFMHGAAGIGRQIPAEALDRECARCATEKGVVHERCRRARRVIDESGSLLLPQVKRVFSRPQDNRPGCIELIAAQGLFAHAPRQTQQAAFEDKRNRRRNSFSDGRIGSSDARNGRARMTLPHLPQSHRWVGAAR